MLDTCGYGSLAYAPSQANGVDHEPSHLFLMQVHQFDATQINLLFACKIRRRRQVWLHIGRLDGPENGQLPSQRVWSCQPAVAPSPALKNAWTSERRVTCMFLTCLPRG
ncbi:hypothetical protein DL546_008774 [Coniochaeta pulveracea]|uniref:Uncharacterized protein n=1 Tax=Coniochaeta pulveracea TaxID=177199 RepID=A0A420YNN0_9PEZI|nr:hypothetical protein DL546_008774 [Coniochaeta pulveracea]